MDTATGRRRAPGAGIVRLARVTLAGFWLGSSVHNLERYLLPIIAVIAAISVLPIVVEAVRPHRSSRGAA